MGNDIPSGPTALAARLLPLIDLTLLGEDDPPEAVEALCDRARTPWGEVAAVCVHPEHVTTAKRRLHGTRVRVATVVNFPDGGEYIGRAVRETRRALAAGADEIDAVLPYGAMIRGDTQACADLVRAVRRCVDDSRRLKLIVECGELVEPDLIRLACRLGLEQRVDFLKTSTGKVPVNATPDAARLMLECIRDDGGRCGFKAAGGIRTLEDAGVYLALAERILGPAGCTQERFRIGASALLDAVTGALAASRADSIGGS